MKFFIKTMLAIPIRLLWKNSAFCIDCGKIIFHKENLRREFHKSWYSLPCPKCEFPIHISPLDKKFDIILSKLRIILKIQKANTRIKQYIIPMEVAVLERQLFNDWDIRAFENETRIW